VLREQFQHGNIAMLGGVANGLAVIWVGAGFEQEPGEGVMTRVTRGRPQCGQFHLGIAVPCVVVIRIRTMLEDEPCDSDETGGVHIAPARMRDVEERLPLFRTAFGRRASGRSFNCRANDINLTEHKCGVKAGAGDLRVLGKQSFRAFGSTVDHGADELIGGGVELKREFLDPFTQRIPGMESVFAGDDGLGVV
jgi:hypothetical protein